MDATIARRGSTLLAMLVGSLLLALAGSPAAHACTCTSYTFEEAVEAADLIADVTVEHSLVEVAGEVTYYAVVDTVWKGEQSRTIRLRTNGYTTACGLGRIPVGESLLLWGSGADGEYDTTWCALPMKAGPDVQERLTEQLGAPADLTDQPVPVEMDSLWRPPLWVLAAVPALAVGGAAAQNMVAAVAVLVVLRRDRLRG